MMGAEGISEALLQRLQHKAKAAGIAVDELLVRLLDSAEDAARPAPLEHAHFKLFLDYAPGMTVVHTPDGEILYSNIAYRAPSEPPEAYTGRNLFEHIPPHIVEDIKRRLASLTPENPLTSSEYRLEHSSTREWEFWQDRAFFNDAGEVLFYLSIGQDITERKRALEALQESERQLTTLLDNLPGMVYRCAAHKPWEMTFVSSGCEALTGYAPERLLSGEKLFADLVHPDDCERVAESVQAATEQGVIFEVEYRIITADGAVKHVWERGIAIQEGAGEAYLEGFITDITQRKQAEERLRESEALYESLVQTLPMHVYRIDREGRLTFVNDRLMRDLGLPCEEILGKTAYDFYSEEMAQKYRADDARVLERGEPLHLTEANISPTSGETRYVEVIKTPIQDQLGNIRGIQGVFFDVTDRKLLEMHLAESSAKLQAIFDNTVDALFLTGDDARYIDVNPAGCDLLGYSREELMGMVIEDVTHPQQREAMPDDWEEFTEEGTQEGEYILQRKDGSRVVIEFSAVSNILPGVHLSIARDITERKRNEQLTRQMERLKTRIQQEREHNLLIERIISALSHDLRTPLTVMQSSKDLLQMHHARLSEERRADLLDTIERQIQFATHLLEDTVQMARGTLSEQPFNPQPTNLNLLCRITAEEVMAANDGTHRITVNNAAGLEIVSVDEVLVSRILLNLLSNAIKYSPAGSPVTLELDREDAWLRLCVRDQGRGIAPDELPHIFEPFYRSDDVHEISGTGLGLSIVRDCVQRHHGRIGVKSEPGKGSAFTVWLPSTEEAPTA